MNMLINEILLVVAGLTVGVVYGTDMFHAVVVKRAAALSSDHAIADLVGHTHLIADKRMPPIGIAGVVSSTLLTILNYNSALGIFSGISLTALIAHLIIYFKVAKPINTLMSRAAMTQTVPTAIRDLQHRWDSVIVYRAMLLTVAMLAIFAGIFTKVSGGA